MNKIILCVVLLWVILSGCQNDSNKVISDEKNTDGFFSDTVGEKAVLKNNVAVAQYFLDAAGFHGMSETLVASSVIDSNYQYTVARVKKVLTETVWPTDLDADAQAFIANLNLFYTALADNQVPEATILSTTIHDDQHDLSHGIDNWLTATNEMGVVANQFDISASQFILDSAGFHGMSESLTTNQAIDSTYNSIVKRVKKVLAQTTWPTELSTNATALISSLGLFSDALAANNVADAIVLGETIHDAQHDFSSAIDAWVATITPANLKVSTFGVSVTQNFLDAAGFHGMDERLTANKAIDPTFNSVVKRVRKVLKQTVWPAELNTKAQALIVTLGLFSDSLATNNVADATSLAGRVHEEQHELSELIDTWLLAH